VLSGPAKLSLPLHYKTTAILKLFLNITRLRANLKKAIFPSINLSRQYIFTAIQLLKTATFEESGRDGGHLATLIYILGSVSGKLWNGSA
jgi:hypothetical protein